MAHDTVINTGYDGISLQGRLHARVDSAIVDSAQATTLMVASFDRASVNAVRLMRGTFDGLYLNGVDTFALTNSRIELMGSAGLFLSSLGAADSSRIRGNIIDAAQVGIRAYGGDHALDSNRITNHLIEGLVIDFDAAVRARRSRLSGNGLGVRMTAFARPSWFSGIIAGNINRQGAYNDGTVTLDADSTYWGDPGGPACSGAVGDCNGTNADSVLTAFITFDIYESTPDPLVPAPPALMAPSRVKPVPAARPRPPLRAAAAATIQSPTQDNVRRRIPKSAGNPAPHR
jgi:hypothetical protein